MHTLRIVGVFLAFILISVTAQAAPPSYDIQVDGLACPFCAYGIEKKLSEIEGVNKVEVDIESGLVIVTMGDETILNRSEVEKAVTAAGFSVRDLRVHQSNPEKIGE